MRSALGLHKLTPHPAARGKAIINVTAQIVRECTGELWLEYMVASDGKLKLPDPSEPRRADGLWRSTCFELFARPAYSKTYREFNFSPSSEWAAYKFREYRSGMEELSLAVTPEIELSSNNECFWLAVNPISLEAGDEPWTVSLSAVVGELDGTKSYWALTHPSETPDFHHPDCFVLELSAATTS